MKTSRLICCAFVAGALAAQTATIPPVGILPGDPLERLGLKSGDLKEAKGGPVRFLRKSRYLNGKSAVVTHTVDDTNKLLPAVLDAVDKHGVKTTFFVSTAREPIGQLWPLLEQAVRDGHEIGSHARTHRCSWPDTAQFCAGAYNESEIAGSRDDILKNTSQPYVWAWCYPCGLCAGYPEVHQKLAAAGYLVARSYPDEARDGHVVPNLQTWDKNTYNATYTQVAQKLGGIAKSGRTDVAELNAKYDEVYKKGGIYNFMSHPQWLDYGPDAFYEKHLAHIGRRPDVWYVPMGPLYAFRTVVERTEVRGLAAGKGSVRFAVVNDLDPKIYTGSLTLEFTAPPNVKVLSNGKELAAPQSALTDRWDGEYVRRENGIAYVTVRPGSILEFR